MKSKIVLLSLLLLSGMTVFAQVGISIDGSTPDQSAILETKSTTRGFLPPRMTSYQIASILNPANGLFVFCTDDNKLYVFISSSGLWKEVAFGPGTITQIPLCGNTLAINHVAGIVAPVTKSTLYSTVNGIPGEPAKCWISSNLGSDHQATAVNDATEASAGWYWQFNRKQGYKHDGTNVTPAWPASSYSDDSDWLQANDPCTLELGSSWRMPTSTEWYNVDNAGSWTTWTDPWNSGLKLHSAGYINYSNGLCWSRGVNGYYWSKTQNNPTFGNLLSFSSGSSTINNDIKAYGFSIRCLRDN